MDRHSVKIHLRCEIGNGRCYRAVGVEAALVKDAVCRGRYTVQLAALTSPSSFSLTASVHCVYLGPLWFNTSQRLFLLHSSKILVSSHWY